MSRYPGNKNRFVHDLPVTISQALKGNTNKAKDILEHVVYMLKHGEPLNQCVSDYLADALQQIIDSKDPKKAASALNLNRKRGHRNNHSPLTEEERIEIGGMVYQKMQSGLNQLAAVAEVSDSENIPEGTVDGYLGLFREENPDLFSHTS